MNERQKVNKIIHTYIDVNNHEDYTDYKGLITALIDWKNNKQIMNRRERIKIISQAIYNDYIKQGWKNVSIYDCEIKAMHYVDIEIIVEKLNLTDVSGMFSTEQMEQAYNDGVEAEQQRCGEFNIENYC